MPMGRVAKAACEKAVMISPATAFRWEQGAVAADQRDDVDHDEGRAAEGDPAQLGAGMAGGSPVSHDDRDPAADEAQDDEQERGCEWLGPGRSDRIRGSGNLHHRPTLGGHADERDGDQHDRHA